MKIKFETISIVLAGLLFCIFSCQKEAPKVVPTLTTLAATNITSTTASIGGTISSDGNVSVTSRGVCWSTNQNPTIIDSKTSDGIGIGTFTSSITGLSPGRTYYVKAYAINTVGTAYGNEVTITTTSILPILTTIELLGISSTTATGGGNITSDGGATVIARGVCWSTNQNPTITKIDSITANGTGIGIFSSSITGLKPGATYYIRAYATNSIGTAYGNQLTATTSAVLPELSTSAVSEVTSTSAICGGNITSDGGAVITSRGVCWSTNHNPTISGNKSTDGAGTGGFMSSITGLLPGRTYYVRAYALNNEGTAYGNEISFSTLATLVTLTTSPVSSITKNSAISGGNISSDGGGTVTARGVCWSTNQNPTIVNSKTTNGTGTGSFTSYITDLTPGTSYYIRAYSTNGAGTAYGNQVSLTTVAILPTLTTYSVNEITPTTAESGGNITSSGDVSVLFRGVCWSTSSDPTIFDSKTTNGSGTGQFTSVITGLTPATLYYVRAYATNSAGTGYGDIFSFFSGGGIIQFNPNLTYGTVADIEGNVYKTIIIGTQTWMAENLKTTKYSNGNSIGTTTPATLGISAESAPKYQWAYAGNEINVATYGRLYTWSAATDSRNVCPAGWHVPTNAEWTTLTTYLGGESVAGDKFRESGTSHWASPYPGTTNSSGLTALPGAYRSTNGRFFGIGYYCYWWSSTEYSTYYAWHLIMVPNSSSAHSKFLDNGKSSGFSVRCLRDL